ncbi:hypothetical protein B9Q04_18760, partial [Candidatus Marsarchaeota G2 archaeon BE_D]
MLDIRLIRKDPEKVRKNIERRHKQAYLENFDKLIFVDLELRKKQSELDAKRAEHNKLTRRIAELKKSGQKSEDLEKQASLLVDEVSKLELELEKLSQERERLLKLVPNLLDDEVPDGLDETQNRVVKVVGEPKKFGFQPKSHIELITELDLADLERAA